MEQNGIMSPRVTEGVVTVRENVMKSTLGRSTEFASGRVYVAPEFEHVRSADRVDLCDDPTVIPEGYDAEVIWEGLGMVSFGIAPHYQSNHPESDLIDRVVEYFEHHQMPYEALKDGEAIVINGNKQERLS